MSFSPLILEDVLAAKSRLRRYLDPSPLWPSPSLSQTIGGQVFLKCDHLLPCGSWRARDVLYRLMLDPPDSIVLSTNDVDLALAVAWAATTLGISAKIGGNPSTMPIQDQLESLGAQFVPANRAFTSEPAFIDGSVLQGDPLQARAAISAAGSVFIELVETLPHFDDWLLPQACSPLVVGGALAWSNLRPQPSIWSCRGQVSTPSNFPPVAKLLAETGAELAPDYGEVPEKLDASALEAAQQYIANFHKQIVADWAAAPLAYLLAEPDRFKGRTVVISLVSGHGCASRA